MSVSAIRSVLKFSESRLSARLVLFVIADNAHDDGISWEGNAKIARKALVSLSEVKRSVAELEEIGELEKRKAQRGRRRINVYRVTLPGIDDPVYDDLPFVVDRPFQETESKPLTEVQVEPPSKIDDGSSGAFTAAHSAPFSADVPLTDLRRNYDPSEAKASEARDAPPLTLVDGQNVGLNALAEECGIVHADATGIAIAASVMAGKKDRGAKLDGIRDAFWKEAVEWAEQNGELDRLLSLAPADLEASLAKAVRRKAKLYRDRMPAMPVTPKALLEWWFRLSAPPPRRGMSADDIERYGATDG